MVRVKKTNNKNVGSSHEKKKKGSHGCFSREEDVDAAHEYLNSKV